MTPTPPPTTTTATILSRTTIHAARGLGVGLAATLATLVSAGIGLPDGAAFTGGESAEGVEWEYDTGADETILNAESADDMGLLDDDDGDGVPDAASGSKTFNGTLHTWCFDDIGVECKDSDGDICIAFTTVYVSKDSGDWLSKQNLLGKDIRKQFKGQWDDETETVNWQEEHPWINALGLPPKFFAPAVDNDGQVKRVIQNVELHGANGVTSRDFTIIESLPWSVVPLGAIAQIGAPIVGQIDLAQADPDAWHRLQLADQLQTMQPVFQIAMLEATDLGLGAAGGRIPVLVSNNKNSNFGVIGASMIPRAVEGYRFVQYEAAGNDDAVGYIKSPGGGGCASDVNGDGATNSVDLNEVLANFGQLCE